LIELKAVSANVGIMGAIAPLSPPYGWESERILLLKQMSISDCDDLL